jgi:antitoxin HigA-1
VRIRSFVHKGLERLYARDSVRGVPPDTADKLRKMALKNPPHPGAFIRTEITEPSGLSVTAAAAALQVSRPALSSLLNGKADLSGEMALRIEKAFGVKMDTLMRMQSAYDIARIRKREKEIRIRRIHPVTEAHP